MLIPNFDEPVDFSAQNKAKYTKKKIQMIQTNAFFWRKN